MASQLTLFGESMVNTKSTRRTYTRESKLSVVAVPIINFSPSNFIASELQWYNIDHLYDSTLLSCTRATKKASRFWVWSISAFIIKRILGNKRIFPCSFGNKHMRLLTRVYGTMTGKMWCKQLLHDWETLSEHNLSIIWTWHSGESIKQLFC